MNWGRIAIGSKWRSPRRMSKSRWIWSRAAEASEPMRLRETHKSQKFKIQKSSIDTSPAPFRHIPSQWPPRIRRKVLFHFRLIEHFICAFVMFCNLESNFSSIKFRLDQDATMMWRRCAPAVADIASSSRAKSSAGRFC